MVRRLLPIVLLAWLLAPAPAQAWGADAHHVIMERAIALLPAEIRPLFEKRRAEVVERVLDPDTWRTAGFEVEAPNHFLDIDVPAYGPYPFAALPRDYDAAVLTFGTETVRRNGLLPWRTAEMYGNLRRAFEAYRTPTASGQEAIVYVSAWMAHYASDAHQPLHGVANYNGQLTGQIGVHARFETTLFERYHSRLRIAPHAIPPVRNPRDFIFDAVLEDTMLAPILLKADLDAIGTGDVYDNAYYDTLFSSVGGMMERRLNESMAAVAALIAGAWEAAGKPAVPVELPVVPERRRR